MLGSWEQPARSTEALVQDLMVPVPSSTRVPNLSNLLDLPRCTSAVSRRCCAKSSQPLLAILARATNAGSRGWEARLQPAAKDSDGAVRVCMHASACASGLHPCVHPAARRDWRVRFVTLRAWRAQNQTAEFKDICERRAGRSRRRCACTWRPSRRTARIARRACRRRTSRRGSW